MASTPYYAFGKALAAARLAAKIESQKDLAMRLGVTQQSVSRWEAGTHRPRPAQLPAIAAALGLNVGDLRILIGDEGVPAVSTVTPFPLDRLDPNTFEAFIADFLHLLHPGAKTRRCGSTGQFQNGLDVEAVLPEGRRIGVQCKRREQFGPAEFHKAAKAMAADFDVKILALSRIASPQLAQVVENSPKWTLWDKDDISRRIIPADLAFDTRPRPCSD
jgi:transcriptional regulator with XRE-family HTH domain